MDSDSVDMQFSIQKAEKIAVFWGRYRAYLLDRADLDFPSGIWSLLDETVQSRRGLSKAAPNDHALLFMLPYASLADIKRLKRLGFWRTCIKVPCTMRDRKSFR